MNIIFILVPLSFFMSISALFALIWAIKKGQFNDLETPRHSICFEDRDHTITKETKK